MNDLSQFDHDIEEASKNVAIAEQRLESKRASENILNQLRTRIEEKEKNVQECFRSIETVMNDPDQVLQDHHHHHHYSLLSLKTSFA